MSAKTPMPMRHNFAVKTLEKLPGLFPPRRYLYYCVRCRWSFLVNDPRYGAVTALDSQGQPMEHREAAARRVETFAIGPCPAFLKLRTALRVVKKSNGAAPTRIDQVERIAGRS